MQRFMIIGAICSAIVFGATGCTSVGICGAGGCATGACGAGGCGRGTLLGDGECNHVGGKCDCDRFPVQGTCNYYGNAMGTAVAMPAPMNVTPAPAKAIPAGAYEEIPAPKTEKTDGR